MVFGQLFPHKNWKGAFITEGTFIKTNTVFRGALVYHSYFAVPPNLWEYSLCSHMNQAALGTEWAAARQNQQMTCAPREDLRSAGHPPILIRVFAVCMKKHWTLNYLLSAQRRLIRLVGCPGWFKAKKKYMCVSGFSSEKSRYGRSA